jgi:hypothetical protein
MSDEGTTDYTNLNFLSSVAVLPYLVAVKAQKRFQLPRNVP